jgi:hypothetical protein
MTINENTTLADGSGSEQADKEWGDADVLAPDADVDIDLAGSLVDLRGDTITFASIKALIVRNTSDKQTTPTAAAIQVGGGDGGDGTNAWDSWVTSTAGDGSEAVIIPAGGAHAWLAPQAGYPVTADTEDILRLLNLDDTDQAAYEIMAVGVKA